LLNRNKQDLAIERNVIATSKGSCNSIAAILAIAVILAIATILAISGLIEKLTAVLCNTIEKVVLNYIYSKLRTAPV
jgi:hypothetical protein